MHTLSCWISPTRVERSAHPVTVAASTSANASVAPTGWSSWYAVICEALSTHTHDTGCQHYLHARVHMYQCVWLLLLVVNQTPTHMYTFTHLHIYIHTYYTRVRSHTGTCINAHTDKNTYSSNPPFPPPPHTQTHTNSLSHSLSHTQSHTYTHTLIAQARWMPHRLGTVLHA